MIRFDIKVRLKNFCDLTNFVCLNWQLTCLWWGNIFRISKFHLLRTRWHFEILSMVRLHFDFLVAPGTATPARRTATSGRGSAPIRIAASQRKKLKGVKPFSCVKQKHRQCRTCLLLVSRRLMFYFLELWDKLDVSPNDYEETHQRHQGPKFCFLIPGAGHGWGRGGGPHSVPQLRRPRRGLGPSASTAAANEPGGKEACALLQGSRHRRRAHAEIWTISSWDKYHVGSSGARAPASTSASAFLWWLLDLLWCFPNYHDHTMLPPCLHQSDWGGTWKSCIQTTIFQLLEHRNCLMMLLQLVTPIADPCEEDLMVEM